MKKKYRKWLRLFFTNRNKKNLGLTPLILLFTFIQTQYCLCQPSIVQPWVNSAAENLVSKFADKVFTSPSFQKFKEQRTVLKSELEQIQEWTSDNKITEYQIQRLKGLYVKGQSKHNFALSQFVSELIAGIKGKRQLKQVTKTFINISDSLAIARQFVEARLATEEFHNFYLNVKDSIEGQKSIAALLSMIPLTALFELAKGLVAEISKIDYNAPIELSLKVLQDKIKDEFNYPNWPDPISSISYKVRQTIVEDNQFTYSSFDNYIQIISKNSSIPLKLVLQKDQISILKDPMKVGDLFYIQFNSVSPAYLFAYDTEKNVWTLVTPTIACGEKSIIVRLQEKNEEQVSKTNWFRFPSGNGDYLEVQGENPYQKEMLFLLLMSGTPNPDFICNIQNFKTPGLDGIKEIIKWSAGELEFQNIKLENSTDIIGSKSIGLKTGSEIPKSQIIYFEIPRSR